MKRWLIVLVVLVAACGGGSSGPTYNAPADIAAKLQANGGCVDYTATDPNASSSNNLTKDYEAAAGKCTFNGEALKIIFYKDAGAKSNAVGLAASFGCQLAKGFGVTAFDCVEGGLWTVTPKTETTAKSISQILGGAAKHIGC